MTHCNECGEKVVYTRRYTSDLYQVDVCEDCIADREEALLEHDRDSYQGD